MHACIHLSSGGDKLSSLVQSAWRWWFGRLVAMGILVAERWHLTVLLRFLASQVRPSLQRKPKRLESMLVASKGGTTHNGCYQED